MQEIALMHLLRREGVVIEQASLLKGTENWLKVSSSGVYVLPVWSLI